MSDTKNVIRRILSAAATVYWFKCPTCGGFNTLRTHEIGSIHLCQNCFQRVKLEEDPDEASTQNTSASSSNR